MRIFRLAAAYLLIAASCSLPTTAGAESSHFSSAKSIKQTRVDHLATDHSKGNIFHRRQHFPKRDLDTLATVATLRGGSAGGFFFIPAGWNPLGYKITELGEEFLSFEGVLDGDLGRFLASLKAGRRRTKALKQSWLEIVRASKTGQAMRIYRQLDDLLLFSLKAGLIN